MSFVGKVKLLYLYGALVKLLATEAYENVWYYGTKTAYNLVVDDFPMNSTMEKTDAKQTCYSFCHPVQMNGLIRHGIRNPGAKDIDCFVDVVKRIEASLSQNKPEMYSAMNRMKNIVLSAPPKSLLEEGHHEQKMLAERYMSKFPELFMDLESGDVKMMASSVQRAIDSCTAFIASMQQQMNSVVFDPIIDIDDRKLRFFDKCKKYIGDIEKSKSNSCREFYAFREQHFPQVASKVNQKLNLKESEYVTAKDVKPLYIMAAIEVAVLKTSYLTSLFDEEDLMVMEYAADLKHYWKKSYGHAINYEQSCPVLVDIFHGLEEAVKGNRYHRAELRFAHAETVLPFQALLGLFKDELTLKADNFHLLKERKFRTSNIMPFSANVIFILYKCDMKNMFETLDDQVCPSELWDEYMVQLLVNERPVKIPGCAHDLCSYKLLKQLYHDLLKSCDLDEICDGPHDEL